MVVFASLVAINTAYNEGDPCFAPNATYYGYYAPHPVYCYRFLQCTNSRFISRNCSPGLYWNPNEGFNGACDWPANVHCEGLTTQRTTTQATTTAPPTGPTTGPPTAPTTTEGTTEYTTYYPPETTYQPEPTYEPSEPTPTAPEP